MSSLDLASPQPAAAAAAIPEKKYDPRTRALIEGPIAATLIRLAAPNMLVMLAQTSVGLVETYFIGKLGTDPLAGVALVFPLADADADDVGRRHGRRHFVGDRTRARRRPPRRCRRAGVACAGHRAAVRADLHGCAACSAGDGSTRRWAAAARRSMRR